MPDPIVLDTNVFDDKSFLAKLKTYHGAKIIPAIVYTEICVHYYNKGKSHENIDRLLRRLKIEYEWFRREQAREAAELGSCYGDFKKNARDYIIASHAYTAPRKLITFNTKHFQFLEDRVLEPYEFLKSI